MMRKLLVLLIVLAMASVSQASVIDLVINSLNGNPITPRSEITISISDVINFDIIYIQAGDLALLSLDTTLSATGPGTLDVSELTWHPGSDASFNRVIENEAGVTPAVAMELAKLGEKVRHLKEHGLAEGVSTRLLIYAGRLITEGIPARRACQVAVVWALTDERDVQRSIEAVVSSIFE